jgi:hypothetical protein
MLHRNHWPKRNCSMFIKPRLNVIWPCKKKKNTRNVSHCRLNVMLSVKRGPFCFSSLRCIMIVKGKLMCVFFFWFISHMHTWPDCVIEVVHSFCPRFYAHVEGYEPTLLLIRTCDADVTTLHTHTHTHLHIVCALPPLYKSIMTTTAIDT